MQTIRCPHCNTEFQYPEDQGGSVVTCLGCGQGIKLPEPEAPAPVRPRRPGRPRRSLAPALGWLSLAAVLVAAGLLWLTVLQIRGATGPPRVGMAMLLAGFAVLILWFLSHYVRLALGRRRRR